MKKTLLISLLNIFFVLNIWAQKQPEKSTQPNIIFILTDDLGYGDLGVFFQKQREKKNDRSKPWALTPNLDQFAANGAQLMQHYTSAPVCAPARASILTGLHQGHANVRNNQFDKALEDNFTLGNVLQKAGYSTAAIGKWGLQGDSRWDYNGDKWPGSPLNRGFDYFFGYMRHSDGHEHYPKEGLYRGAKEVYENREEISKDLDKCYTGDLWTAVAKKYIVDHKKGQESNKPFFIYLAYDTPHAVLELPTQAYPAGKGLNGGIQWTGKPGQMINTASGTIDSWVHSDYINETYDHDNNPSTAEIPWPDTYKRYASVTRRIDDQIGDLMQLLKDLHIDSNTIVVFTSDNGPSQESYLPKSQVAYEANFFDSFGPFDGVKRDVWEGGVRMPALVSWPERILPKTVVTTPNASYDWLSTFCDAAGFPAPARTDGVSLIPSLTGQGKQAESLIYIEYFEPGSTPKYPEFEAKRRGRIRNQMQLIRMAEYVGVRYDIKEANDDFEIYNVDIDPKEITDLAGNPEMKSLQEKMKEKVLQIRRPDTSAPRPYDSEFVHSVQRNTVASGVSWEAYSGLYPWLPNTNNIIPAAQGFALLPSVNAFNFKEGGMIYFEGYLRIPTDGEYTFYLNADNSFLFRIHEAKVIDADYGYLGNSEQNGTIRLKAGLHPFSFYYKKTVGKENFMGLKWKGPGIVKQNIPATVFFR